MTMIYVLLLAYNEEESIRPCLTQLYNVLKAQEEAFRFVVVDDGSTDRTSEKVAELDGSVTITLLRHPNNLGVARAFDTGLRHIARHTGTDDIVVTLEGDNTNDPSFILEMLRGIREGSDVVCASRYCAGGRYVGFPWRRYIVSLAANWSIWLLFPIAGVRDYTIFFRAYRAAVLLEAIRCFGDRFIECQGFTANVEILYKVVAVQPIRCSEIQLTYRYDLKRGNSKMRVFRNILDYGTLFVKLLSLKISLNSKSSN